MPKIDNYLTATQKQALKIFFEYSWKYLLNNNESDTNSNDATNSLEFLDQNFIDTINQLDPNTPLNLETQAKLHNIFATLTNLLSDQSLAKIKDLPILNKIFETNIKPMIDLMDQLKNIADNYLTNIDRNNLESATSSSESTANSTTSSKTETNITSTTNLVDLILAATDPAKSSDNPKIYSEHLYLIQEAMGKDLFIYLTKRYQINLDKFYLDDIRMLIIGILANCQQDWRQNAFIINLLAACNIDYLNKNDSELIEQLRKNVQLTPEVLRRISKDTLNKSIFNLGLSNIAKKFIPEFYNLLPIKFKANRSFKKDLKTVTALTNIESWQNKHDPKLQSFAATEFTFNKLSNADLNDGSIVPILTKQGEMILCKAKNFIDAKSIHGFALIPIDPSKSQEIKVVFKNSNLLGEAIFDLEHYFPYRAFKQHRAKILSSLNNIVQEFQQSPEITSSQKNSISLDIGGHGTGGTIAQLLVHELAKQRAHSVININPNINSTSLNESLEKSIEHQYNLEHPNSNLDQPNLIDQKNKQLLKVKKYAAKHWFNPPKNSSDTATKSENLSDLNKINDIKLSTVNAGGIPSKIRLDFIQAMQVIKNHQRSENDFKITCEKIINTQDLVAKTGETDLAAYVPASLMPTTVMQFQTPTENQYQENLKEIAVRSALVTTKFFLSKLACITTPFLGSTIGSLLEVIDNKEQLEKIEENITSMKNHASTCHRNTYFNLPEDNLRSLDFYQELNNQPLSGKTDSFNQTLSCKIPPSNSNKVFRKIKKQFYNSLRAIKTLYNKINPEPINYVKEDEKGRGNVPIFIPNSLTLNNSSVAATNNPTITQNQQPTTNPTLKNNEGNI